MNKPPELDWNLDNSKFMESVSDVISWSYRNLNILKVVTTNCLSRGILGDNHLQVTIAVLLRRICELENEGLRKAQEKPNIIYLAATDLASGGDSMNHGYTEQYQFQNPRRG